MAVSVLNRSQNFHCLLCRANNGPRRGISSPQKFTHARDGCLDHLQYFRTRQPRSPLGTEQNLRQSVSRESILGDYARRNTDNEGPFPAFWSNPRKTQKAIALFPAQRRPSELCCNSAAEHPRPNGGATYGSVTPARSAPPRCTYRSRSFWSQTPIDSGFFPAAIASLNLPG